MATPNPRVVSIADQIAANQAARQAGRAQRGAQFQSSVAANQAARQQASLGRQQQRQAYYATARAGRVPFFNRPPPGVVNPLPAAMGALAIKASPSKTLQPGLIGLGQWLLQYHPWLYGRVMTDVSTYHPDVYSDLRNAGLPPGPGLPSGTVAGAGDLDFSFGGDDDDDDDTGASLNTSFGTSSPPPSSDYSYDDLEGAYGAPASATATTLPPAPSPPANSAVWGTIAQSISSTLPAISTYQTQSQILALQLARAQAGLPPLNVAGYTGQATPAAAPATIGSNSTLFLIGAAVIGFLLLSKKSAS